MVRINEYNVEIQHDNRVIMKKCYSCDFINNGIIIEQESVVNHYYACGTEETILQESLF